MHSDPGLVERLFEILPAALQPKKMFGGQCWMLNGNICVGVYKEFLITRIGADAYGKISTDPSVHPMDITGKPMKGWAKISPDGIEDDDVLKRYLDLAVRYVGSLAPKRPTQLHYSFYEPSME